MRESWTVNQTSLDTAPQSVHPVGKIAVDRVCAAAVDLAFSAAQKVAGPTLVGEHAGVEADAERIVTHYFACTDRAYTDWRWAVTVVRVPSSKTVTVDEVVLLPGPTALLAPPWVPWSDRMLAGDLGIGDVLPTAADDERLLPGYAALGAHDDTDDVDTIDYLVQELWLGRPRVLSPTGRDDAADRWYDGDRGPTAPIDKAAELTCGSCGFLLLMRGALSRVFGVCANEYAPDDGRVVSFDHGCGAHSEALVVQTGPVGDEPEVATELTEIDADEVEVEALDAEAAHLFEVAEVGPAVATVELVDVDSADVDPVDADAIDVDSADAWHDESTGEH
jgi:hypothetical protein